MRVDGEKKEGRGVWSIGGREEEYTLDNGRKR